MCAQCDFSVQFASSSCSHVRIFLSVSESVCLLFNEKLLIVRVDNTQHNRQGTETAARRLPTTQSIWIAWHWHASKVNCLFNEFMWTSSYLLSARGGLAIVWSRSARSGSPATPSAWLRRGREAFRRKVSKTINLFGIHCKVWVGGF